MANQKIYRNRSSEPVKAKSNAGSKYANTYEITIDENKHKVLAKTGETNIYATIQEGLEESKIENILARAGQGDVTALYQREAQYGDFTNAPKTLAEAQKMIISIQNEFDKLPAEVKAKFDHSAERYVEEYGSQDWQDKTGVTEYKNKLAAAKKAEELTNTKVEKEKKNNE